jgi:hypothetical protein
LEFKPVGSQRAEDAVKAIQILRKTLPEGEQLKKTEERILKQLNVPDVTYVALTLAETESHEGR